MKKILIPIFLVATLYGVLQLAGQQGNEPDEELPVAHQKWEVRPAPLASPSPSTEVSSPPSFCAASYQE